MTELTRMERKVLAVLEEAGEENVVALFNTVRQIHPDAEIGEYQAALIRLLHRAFIELAMVREEVSRQWISFDVESSLAELERLNTLLVWSATNRLWTWNSTDPRIGFC